MTMTPATHTGNNSNSGSTQHRLKRTRSDRASTFNPMMKVSEGDENEDEDKDHPDHISTSASEGSSQHSGNSQPPLLNFIGTACMASAWFTSCFPCVVVDLNNCDDKVVEKLDRENAMNLMYGAVAEPFTISNSLELRPGENDEGGNRQSSPDHDELQMEGQGDAVENFDEKEDNLPIIGLVEPRTESDTPPAEPETEEVEVTAPEPEVDLTPATPSRKRFNMKFLPTRPSSGRKLFGRKK